MWLKIHMSYKKIFHTSCDDLLRLFKCSLDPYPLSDLQKALKGEEKYLKRKTMMKLLRRAITQKKLGAHNL